ncbi:MAG: hypothetical protein V2B20_14105 [Pseudomonadota bacterium]
MSSFGENRFSAYYMRRHPITGPIAGNFFRGILGVLTLGSGITGILCFTTGNPLQFSEGNSLQFFLILTLLQSPYLAMFILAFMYVGSGIWRGLILFLGSVAIAGYGLFKVFYLWYLAPAPVAAKVFVVFPGQQWLVVAVTIIVAFLPSVLISSGLDRWAGSDPKRK